MLWPTVLNNPLSQVTSSSLSSKSAANTLRLTYLREEAVSTRTSDDFATTLDVFGVYDTTDVGRLTSALFSQEREVSVIPFCVSYSQTHSSMTKSWQNVEPFSSFGKPLSKGQGNRDLERVQDSQLERENSVGTMRHSRLPCKES